MSGLDGYVNSRQAADLLGLARADAAWRAVRRYADEYPGQVDIDRVGNAYVARREQMEAFARWYRVNVQSGQKSAPAAGRLDERKAALRAAIGRIVGNQENL